MDAAPYKISQRLIDFARRQGLTCRVCGLPVRLDAPKDHVLHPSADHHIPKRDGGADASWNLRLTHAICNNGLVNIPPPKLRTIVAALLDGDSAPLEAHRKAVRIAKKIRRLDRLAARQMGP